MSSLLITGASSGKLSGRNNSSAFSLTNNKVVQKIGYTHTHTLHMKTLPQNLRHKSQSEQMRWRFQGINLFSLRSLSSLSVADISSLYHSRAQPPITTPHRPLLNVYIVTLQTRRHFLTQKTKRADTGSYNKLLL